MNVLECFAGIGGFGLGLERAGMTIKGQIEIDEYCQKVLEKNFPKAKKWRDIQTVSANDIRRRCGKIDLLCGGFPCQDISVAGQQKGATEGLRSGLWRQMYRLIRQLKPTWLLLENVPALRTKGADTIFSALEAAGYTGFATVVGADNIGYPHRRKRVVYLGYANSMYVEKRLSYAIRKKKKFVTISGFQRRELVYAESLGRRSSIRRSLDSSNQEQSIFVMSGELANNYSSKLWQQQGRICGTCGERATFDIPAGQGNHQHDWEEPRILAKSELGRTVNGLPGRVDKHRIKALGNAVIPQIIEIYGRVIMRIQGGL